jgi:SAM-dependent methyltransferase
MTKEQVRKQFDTIGSIIKDNFSEREEVNVLEAGCGSVTHLELSKRYKVTGIDISRHQLERNKNISEKICGDIQVYPLQHASFDLVISWYVLEHIKKPLKAMENFKKALKSNGLIVLALPNIWSVKGIVAKFTPTIVHTWFYKYVLKEKFRGQNDMGPFKTYLKVNISPGNLMQFAAENNFDVVHFAYTSEFEAMNNIKQLNPIVYGIQTVVGAVLWLISLGKITTNNTEFVIVLRKTADHHASM